MSCCNYPNGLFEIQVKLPKIGYLYNYNSSVFSVQDVAGGKSRGGWNSIWNQH